MVFKESNKHKHMWKEEENHSLLVFGVIFFQSLFLLFPNFKKCTITYLIPGEFYI